MVDDGAEEARRGRGLSLLSEVADNAGRCQGRPLLRPAYFDKLDKLLWPWIRKTRLFRVYKAGHEQDESGMIRLGFSTDKINHGHGRSRTRQIRSAALATD